MSSSWSGKPRATTWSGSMGNVQSSWASQPSSSGALPRATPNNESCSLLLRRLVLSGLATSAIAACSTAFAQSGEVTWRIGYFSGGLPLPDNAPPSALRQALRDLGYVEGRNVLYIARAA